MALGLITGPPGGALLNGSLRKTIGLVGPLVAELGDVRGVVAADAEDRGRARDRLQQRDLVQRIAGAGRGRPVGEVIEDGACLEGDDAVVAHLPRRGDGGACGEEGGEFHRTTRRMTGFRRGGLLSMIGYVDVSAIQAAAAATTTTYRSFADATRSVLDLLEHHMPNSARLSRASGSRSVHPPDRGRAPRLGVRAALQPVAPARGRVLLAHGRGPRAASGGGHRRVRRLQAPGDAAARERQVLRGCAAGALRRHARGLTGRRVTTPQRVLTGRRTAVHHARPRAGERA